MRKLSFAGSVLLILVALVAVDRLWSDGKVQPPAPRTHVALVNVTYLFKNYEKFKTHQKKLQSESTEFQRRAKELQDQVTALQKEMQAPGTSAERREKLQTRIQRQVRKIDDSRANAQRILNRESSKLLVESYAEVQQATERYARAHAIELVVQYTDAPPDAVQDLNNPSNIMRKLQAPGGVPLYVAPGVDITRELLAILNSNLPPAKTAP